jgi:hypothetical protein
MASSNRIRKQRLADRGERRFLIDEKMARLVLAVLERHLSLQAADRPAPWLTTVYCDTPDWRIFRAARAGTGVFMRFREYHVRRPSRAFSAPTVWLELKPVEQFTGKTRYELASRAVPALMRGDVELLRDPGEAEDSLARFLAAGARPVLATQYHRVEYAADDGAVRITADRLLSYRTVPNWAINQRRMVPTTLGPVFARHTGVVVEMKWLQELPTWAVTVAEFLESYSLGDSDNKFIVGAGELHERERRGLPAGAAVPLPQLPRGRARGLQLP